MLCVFFKQKSAYDMRISDWSSDVCSSDLSTILELFDGLCSSWSLLPIKAWDAAFQAQGNYLVSRLDDPQWALANITERQNEIAARAPQLAPLICRDFSPLSWEELRNHFTSHTSEGIDRQSVV